MTKFFHVGDRVRVRHEIRRIGRIVRITRNTLGTVCYWLEDGGLFSAPELEPAEGYCVWVGGGEVNDYALSADEAQETADRWRSEGYSDVQIDRI